MTAMSILVIFNGAGLVPVDGTGTPSLCSPCTKGVQTHLLALWLIVGGIPLARLLRMMGHRSLLRAELLDDRWVCLGSRHVDCDLDHAGLEDV